MYASQLLLNDLKNFVILQPKLHKSKQPVWYLGDNDYMNENPNQLQNLQ